MRLAAAIALFFLGKTAALLAQPVSDSLSTKKGNVETETVVMLKNGDEVRGTMTRWQRGDSLFLTTASGERLAFSADEVAKVQQFRHVKGLPEWLQNKPKAPAVQTPVEIETLVDLRNGGQVRGTMVEWERGSHLVIRTHNGLVLRFSESEIAHVRMRRYGGTKPLSDRREYEFTERGWYIATSLGFMPSNNNNAFGIDDGGWRNNFTFSVSAGFMLNRMSGLGAGIAVDKYGTVNELTVVPVYAEYRGYFGAWRHAPYFDVMVGHGFAVDLNTPDGFGIESNSIDGGTFISPNFGIRFGARPHGNFTLDVGARIQRGGFEATSPGFPGPVTVSENLTYRRFTMRFGMVF